MRDRVIRRESLGGTVMGAEGVIPRDHTAIRAYRPSQAMQVMCSHRTQIGPAEVLKPSTGSSGRDDNIQDHPERPHNR